MQIDGDPFEWAATHLPHMTDAEAFAAVQRLFAAGLQPPMIVPFLPPIGTALRRGAASAARDPGERLALMDYRGFPDPLLSLVADVATLVPERYGWALAWVDTNVGLHCTQSLVADRPDPADVASSLREGAGDRFAVVPPWFAPPGKVDVLLGCPTGRTDVVRRDAGGGWHDVEDDRPWAFVGAVMAAPA